MDRWKLFEHVVSLHIVSLHIVSLHIVSLTGQQQATVSSVKSIFVFKRL